MKGRITMKSMMEYNGYHATVKFDADDRIFVGEVFGINDSLNFHGASVEELEAMFHQSIDNYLEMCKHFGKEPDKEFSGAFNVRIPPALHKKISMMAADRHMTLNNFVKTTLESLVKKESNESPVLFVIDKCIQNVSWPLSQVNTTDEFSQFNEVSFKSKKELNICPS